MGIKYSGIFKKLNLFNMTFNYGKEKLTLKKTFALAQGKTKGVLIPEIKSKVEKSNAIVNKVVHFGRTVYGINTGFGPLCDTLISENETKMIELQNTLSDLKSKDVENRIILENFKNKNSNFEIIKELENEINGLTQNIKSANETQEKIKMEKLFAKF